MSTKPRKTVRQDDEDTVIYLGPILQALRKKLILILLAAAVFGAAAWVGTHVFVSPTYRTSFRVYVNNTLDSSDKTSISNADLTAARSLASTYAEIIRGRTVLTEAAAKVGLYDRYSVLNKMVNVSTSSSTEIISVSVTTGAPEVSKALAESIIEVAEQHVSSIVDGSSMRVIDEPFLPTNIYSPHYGRNAAVGALIGMMLVVLIVVLRELLDNRVRDEETLEERFGIAILGSIPNQEVARKSGNNYYAYGYAKADKAAQK